MKKHHLIGAVKNHAEKKESFFQGVCFINNQSFFFCLKKKGSFLLKDDITNKIFKEKQEW